MNLGGLPVPSVHRLLLLRVSKRFPKLLPGVGCSPQCLGAHGTLSACLPASLLLPLL